jgi:transcriptional regulator GlxA family with amidase domain
MKIAILIYDGLTALDAIGPYEVLCLLPDAEVMFVSMEKGPKRTDSGFLSLVADYTLDEVPSPDVVLVPGSSNSTATMMSNGSVIQWLRTADETSRWTTSVCSGALILAAAGLLTGKSATTHWAAAPYLERFGAKFVTERIVQQGKIITAAGVSAGIDMALFLAAQIAGAEVAQSIQLMIEYDPQPPFDAGKLTTASPEVVERARSEMKRLSTKRT